VPFFERDGNDIHYKIWNAAASESPWLTLINGYTRPLNDFGPLATQLSESGLNILSLDNRGAGQTQFQGSFTPEEMAEDVAELWKHLNIAKSSVMGISMGGVIATLLTAKHPASVEKLVIVSAPIAKGFMKAANDHASLSSSDRTRDFERYFSKGYTEKNKLFVTGFTRQMDRFFQDARIIRGARAQRAATESFDLALYLSRIEVPALILHGKEDNIVPFSSAERMKDTLPNATLKAFEHTGHLLLVEKPKELFQEVLSFVSK
jgi:pimeloyl-ACP methyl ester carboxylesterase